MPHHLHILQAARLKGRPSEADLVAAAGLAEAEAAAVLQSLLDSGDLDRAGARLKLTATGRDRLEALLAVERAGVDQDALRLRYHDFGELNTAFKQLITDWQLIDGAHPNDHSDTEYDAAIMRRLRDLHVNFTPLLVQFVRLAPRLTPYRHRFDTALARVESGDHTWLARPLVDSYHTVWFELHEELIGLAGLSRVQEAAAGRAE